MILKTTSQTALHSSSKKVIFCIQGILLQIYVQFCVDVWIYILPYKCWYSFVLLSDSDSTALWMLSSLFSVLRIFTKKIIYDVLALKTYLTINLQILFCPPLYTPLCLSVKRRQTQSSFYPFQFGHLLFQLFLLILYHWCFCLTATLIRYIIVSGTLPVCLSIFIKLLIGQGKIYNYLLAFLCF